MPTRSPSVALRGVQVPRVRLAPSVRANAWEDVADLAKAYGLVLDEWQENVLEAAMGERSDGQWATPTVGVAVPRQNGKGALIEARELAGLLVFGEKTIIHSAHEQKTARVGFERVLSYFENYDDLRKKVKPTGGVMSAIGREYIKLRDGAELHFPARSKGAIRGFSIDCLILDEGQILGDPAWEAIKPTISARPNTQTWLLGTPPTPLDDGAVFTRMRQRGLDGKDRRLCWCEWSAPHDANLDDRTTWALANPALGLRITEEAIADERNEMSDAGFGRERLGMWAVDTTAQRVIPPDVWNDLATEGATGEPSAFAVDMSHDRLVSIGVCVKGEDVDHVELAAFDRADDPQGVIDWLVERVGRKTPVVIDSYSPAASLVPELENARVKVKVASSGGDMAKACGAFYDAAMAGKLSHFAQEPVDQALAGAKKRAIGTAGGWGWDRKDGSINLAPLVAVTLAKYGADNFARRQRSGGTYQR